MDPFTKIVYESGAGVHIIILAVLFIFVICETIAKIYKKISIMKCRFRLWVKSKRNGSPERINKKHGDVV